VSATAIAAEGIRKHFRRLRRWRDLFRAPEPTVALAGVDLSVARGEIFGLLGPNGAGKTTLIKVLAGLVLPDAGRAVVGSHDVVRETLDVHRLVGVVYGDERSFHWRLTVRENLLFYARLYGIARSIAADRVDALIDLVDLSRVADARMLSLSSGMRQRAAIARGLVHEPRVIFMDEPTRSLDPVGAEDLRILIRERVADHGRTVLVATNVMSEAEALCDRLMLLHHGQNLITGTIGDFREQLHPDIVYRIVVGGARSGWEQGLRSIPGITDVRVGQPLDGSGSVTLVMRREASALPVAIRFILDQSLEILSCTKHEASLDEMFREVVRRGSLSLVEASSC
jgi:ABC-2 type transport system ATP-binding protein